MAKARKTVTISDVARAAGVSKGSVSFALNDRPGISAATRAHIVETARRLGWTPSLRGRALSVSRAYAIGLVFQRPARTLATDQYYTSLMAGIQSVLSPRGYSLVTEVVDGPEPERAAYEVLAREGRVDGVVLTDFRDNDSRIEVATANGLAVVSMGQPPVPTRFPVIVSDATTAIRDVVAHLAERGHRSIAQVTGPQSMLNARERRTSYQEQLRAHGLDDGTWVEGDFTGPSGYAATEQLLARRPRPTAVIYSNDLMAAAGMTCVTDHGLAVPADMSIVGWDNIAIGQYLKPALSTIAADPFGDGQVSARCLLDAIGGTTFEAAVRVPDPVFVPRQSTAPAPSA